MTEETAHKMVMGLLVLNARGDDEAILEFSNEIKTLDDMGMMFQAALSVAFAAHSALAALERRDLLEFLEELALSTATIPEPEESGEADSN